MAQEYQSVFQLKVTLRNVRPPIWRRILVPSNFTLERLHHILQFVMGWTNSHLHEFQAGDVRYGPPNPEDWDADGIVSEKRTRLGKVLEAPKDRLLYTYYFWDDWQNDIVVEKVLAREPGMKYPWVLAGKRACPPDDVGGAWGYEEFLEKIRNPKHPEHEEMLEWCGGSFDSEAFDAYTLNLRFHGGWVPAASAEEDRPVKPRRKAGPKAG